jgi:hypothetical protein
MQRSQEIQPVQFYLPSGPITVSAGDLVEIRLALREVLRSQAEANPADYGALVGELDAVAGWSDRGGLHLGPWELNARRTDLVLVRRPPPAPARLFHIAFLERHNKQGWRVARMEIEAVHPR